MNLFILQMIALVSYGNAYLKGKKIPSDFYPSHPVFSPCARILFCGYAKLFPKGPFKGLTGWIKRLFSKRETVKIDIDQPDRWFEFLKGQGCRHLRLRHIPLEQKEGDPNTKWPDLSSQAKCGSSKPYCAMAPSHGHAAGEKAAKILRDKKPGSANTAWNPRRCPDPRKNTTFRR